MIQFKILLNGFGGNLTDSVSKYAKMTSVLMFIMMLSMPNGNSAPSPHKTLDAKQIKQFTVHEKQQQVEILENRVYEIRDLTKEKDNLPASKREELKKEINQIKHKLDFIDGGGIYISGGALLIIIILLILL